MHTFLAIIFGIAAPLVGWGTYHLYNYLAGRNRHFLGYINLIVGVFSAVGLFVNMATQWSAAYAQAWIGDLRTGSTITFPGITEEGFQDLLSREVSSARHGRNTIFYAYVSGAGTCADTRLAGEPNPYKGKSDFMKVSPTSQAKFTLVGRATAPDYRYLIDMEADGCTKRMVLKRAELVNLRYAGWYSAEAANLVNPIGTRSIFEHEVDSVKPLVKDWH